MMKDVKFPTGGLIMKFLKKIINIFLVLNFVVSFGLVYAAGREIRISAPDIRHSDGYYVAKKQNIKRVYVEKKNLKTDEKIQGFYIECMEYGRYVIGDDNSDGIQELMYEICSEGWNNYVVRSFKCAGFGTVVLGIIKRLGALSWCMEAVCDSEEKCFPASKMYIECTPNCSFWIVKSAVDAPGIKSGEVYNCVMWGNSVDKFDEFDYIVNFCAAFIFK